jgi:sugar lactone lactonase YvrE
MGKLAAPGLISFVILSLSLAWRGSAIIVDPHYRLDQFPLQQEIGAVDGLYWSAGWLYAASEGSSAIFRIGPVGQVETLATHEQGISSPEDLLVDESGTVYFTDDDVGGLWRITPGEPATRVDVSSSVAASTEGIARQDTGEMLVGDGESGRILTFDAQGTLQHVWEIAGIRKPESIAKGSDGSVYVADDRSGQIVRRYPDGKAETLLSRRDGLQQPETILWHEEALYIVDNEAGRLMRYRVGGPIEPIAQFGGELRNLQGIACDNEGTIYLSIQTDLRRNRGKLLRLIPLYK